MTPILCPFPAACNDKHSAESFQQIGRQKYGHAEMAQFLINIAQYPQKGSLDFILKVLMWKLPNALPEDGFRLVRGRHLLRENTF